MWIEVAVMALLCFQTPQEMPTTLPAEEAPPPTPSLSAEQAAQAALQAAQAAQQAAEAAQKALELMEKAQRPPEIQAAAPPADKAPPSASAWTNSANINLIFLAGNSSSISLNGKIALSYKTADWIFGGRVYGAYGRARLGTASYSSDIAMQGGVDLRIDRRFNPVLGTYGMAGIEFDHIKSIEARPFAELGVGVIWIDEKANNTQKSLLSTDLGFRYAYESRFRYYPTNAEIPFLKPEDVSSEPRNIPDVQVVAPRVALVFRHMLMDGVTFAEDLEVLWNIINAERFWINSTSKILVRLNTIFSISTALTFKYDSQPADGAKKLDTMLSLGLDAVF
ncbi:MAG: DUF481 domain-containing protein [Cystobacterineae bacterium]|nr:DUF481 domain-containing protein [Cystobacterineae bacterium]